MSLNPILGIWTGIAANDNGFEIEVTLRFTGPWEVGALCGTFTIPTNPCSGDLRLLSLRGSTFELRAENKQGVCGEDETVFDAVELQADGTLLYISRGEGWEARGYLRPAP